MPEGPLGIKFYYDFKSPFSFLAFDPAVELERTHRVRLRFIPHLFDFAAYGGALEARDERSWRKVRYLYMDARRFANERGLVIRGPQRLFDSRLALMSGLFADRQGKFRAYGRRVWELFFKRELDLEKFDQLAPLLREAAMASDDFERYLAGNGPRELAAALAEGERDQVFGVPTFIVDGEPFWGNDRIGWVIKETGRDGTQTRSLTRRGSMPQLRILAITAIVLTLKMSANSVVQGVARTRAKAFVNPEDATMFGAPPAPEEAPMVRRGAAVWRNDLENIPIFLILGLIYAIAGLSAGMFVIYCAVFAVARILHSIFYLNSVQPWRTVAYTVGAAASLALIIHIFAGFVIVGGE